MKKNFIVLAICIVAVGAVAFFVMKDRQTQTNGNLPPPSNTVSQPVDPATALINVFNGNQKYSVQTMSDGNAIPGTMLILNGKMLVEAGGFIMSTDTNNLSVQMIMPQQKTIVHFDFSDDNTDESLTSGTSSLLDFKASTYSKEETINGVTCYKYSNVSEDGSTSIFWLDKRNGTFVADGSLDEDGVETIDTYYTLISENTVKESDFAFEGYRTITVDEFMQLMMQSIE